MPQFDKLTFFSQIFYFCLIFSVYYFYMSHKYIHLFFLYTKLRNKKKNYHLNLKHFSISLLSFLQNTLKNALQNINDIATFLENKGSSYLLDANHTLKQNAFVLNKNLSFNIIALTETGLTVSNKNMTKKRKKGKKKSGKLFKNIKGLINLQGIHFSYKRK